MILVFSFHYPPELAPGASRTYSLIKALLDNKKLKEKDIVLYTANTNRNLSKQKNNKKIINNRLKIVRIKTPFSSNNIFKEVINFIFFFTMCLIFNLKNKPILIIGTSGRFGTNLLAATIANLKKTKFILDIRDLFSLNTKELIFTKYPYFGDIFFNIFINLEKFIYKKATLVNVVSKGFIEFYKKNNFPVENWTFNPNGFNKTFKDNLNNNNQYCQKKEKKILLYAGNLGVGQGIEHLLLKVSKYLPNDWVFIIIGSGKQFKLIKKIINKNELSNVSLKSPVSEGQLIKWYFQSTAFLIHLNNFDCLQYVIPSKSFELGLYNKPIIVGAKGYTAEFLKNEIPNTSVFKPCDGKNAVKVLMKATKKKIGEKTKNKKRDLHLKKYYRKNSSEKLVKLILLKCKI